MKNIYEKLWLSIFVICLFFTAGSYAQTLDTVTFSGRVTDSNGLAIVGATVTATLVETTVERSVTTDEEGRYRIIELAPGTYNVKAAASGFGAKSNLGLITIAGQSLQLNFTLQPGDITAETTVTVTEDDAPVVDITRTVVGGTVTQREIEELPNSTRSPLDLVFTLGGVAEEPLSTRDVAEDRASAGVNQPTQLVEGGIFSLSGGAAFSNNITIDGLDNNDDRVAQERFQPSIDAIAEVQVITNQFSAEYGRASGGRINIRTRAGSNRFRGRAYLFFRDDNLNANTYNNNRRGIPRLPFREYNPGATLSGPIPFGYFKNKTYFFTSYEYRNLDDTTLIDTVVPVGQNPRFALPAPTNTGAQRNDFNASGAFIAPYIATVDTPALNHIFTQRIDHNFTNNHNITFNYQLGRLRNFRQYLGSTRVLEEALQGRRRQNDAFYITDNYVFSSKMVNQFRYQFSTFKPDFASENPLDPVILIRVRDTATVENRSGTLTAGNSTVNFVSTRREKRHQFQETLTYVAGTHSLKFGGDAQVIESENLALGDATGTYNFDSVQEFLDSQVVRFRRNFGTNSVQKNTYYGLFVQDEWKVRPNITLSMGLRYERETIMDDKNNFGPRLAIAYSPGDKGRTVFRAGAGIFYNRALLRTIDDYALGRQQLSFDSRNLLGPSFDADCFLPINATQQRCVFLAALSQSFPNAPTLEDLRALHSPTLDINRGFVTATNFSRRLDADIKIPESYQFNVGFERNLGSGIAFEANFTFNKTTHLWRETNVNAFVLPSQFDTYTDFLLSLGSTVVNNRTYTFELGSMTDAVGMRTPTGATCTATSPQCTVNLNTTNRSTAAASPIGFARQALAARLNRGVNNSLGQIEQVGSMGNSVYEGLILEVRRRFRRLGYGIGASFRAVYTLSRLRDDGIVNTSSAQIPGDFRSEFGPSVQDRRHRFNFSGTFELPNYLGKLRVSPLLRLASGNPFNLSIGGIDRNLDDVSNDRPNFSGNISDLRYRNPGDPYPQSVVSAISLAPIGSPGNLPRNAGRGPAYFVFDVNFSREFKFTERFRLRPTVEVDNIFNARVFTFSSDFINFDNVGTPAFQENFLVPQRTLRQRQILLGIRFDF